MRRFASAALGAALLCTLAASAAPGASTAPPPPPAGAALEALAQPPTYAPIASERIYFVLTDRYDNGDPANDRGGRAGARTTTGYDPTDPGWFHGGDLAGLRGDCADPRRGLARIRALGFTAVWLTPPVQQQTVQGGSAGYHGYWGLDFTTVDPHLGTEADFAALVECAHRLGLKVYLDVVVNHTGDVIIPTGSGYADAPYRDCRGRRFDPARYARGATFPCLRPATMPRVPVVLERERRVKKPAWLNDVRRYHNRGDIQWDSCSALCHEQGDFFGLDDLFTEQPFVVRGLADMHAAWIEKYKVDGFRVDTAKHVNAAFFGRWVPRVLAAARRAGVPDFQIFGEVFVTDAIELAGFVRRRGLPNVLDFPFQDAATRFAAGSAGARALANRLADDDYFRTAAGVAPTPPTFLGNHDMGRAARIVADRASASAGALLQRVLLAHSVLYLLRGAPVVLYGDEVGIVGRGGDKEARQDLFPTAVASWRREERVGGPPIGAGSSFDVASPVAAHLRALADVRSAYPELSTAPSVVRRAEGPLLAITRRSAQREVATLFNSGTAPVRAEIATSVPDADWRPVLGTASGARSGADGRLAVTVPPLAAVVLVSATAPPERAAAPPRVAVAADDLTELVRLTATRTGGASSVAFALQRARGGSWRRLAVDDTPPFRAFLDPRGLRPGELVHVVAVARGGGGSSAVSAVVPYRVARR